MTLSAEKEVAEVVREYIRSCHPEGITLEVVEEGIRKRDYWWQVPVRPDRWPDRTSEYYETLAEVESKIQEERKMHILLAPCEPETTH